MNKMLDILYIGKSTDNINSLQSFDGISITSKGNSLDVVNFLKSAQNLSAIICEMTLSGWNGLEMHDWVRSKKELFKIPFILVSFEFKDDLFKAAFNRHVDDFFVVPLPPAENLAGRIQFLQEFRSKNCILNQ
jgi:PleD family two-component response regulator